MNSKLSKVNKTKNSSTKTWADFG